jgi:hypothetical protein
MPRGPKEGRRSADVISHDNPYNKHLYARAIELNA